MTSTWRFKDEWIIRALAGVKGAEADAIARMRTKAPPYLSHVLIDSGILTADEVGKAVEKTFKIKYLALAPKNADKFGISLLQEKTCRKYNVLPVGVSEGELRLAMANPMDMHAQADLEVLAARRVVPLFSLPRAIDFCMEKVFSSDKTIYNLLNITESPDEVQVLGSDYVADVDDQDYMAAPVVMLVNSIISQAYHRRSSDIHIEHEEKGSQVRIRVDGVLKSIMTLPRNVAAGPLVSRIKIMAELDVSNHMRPQDGRTKIRIGGNEVALRVSTLPTIYGEKVVMRLLDQRAVEVPFEKLGCAPEVAAIIQSCIEAPQGMLLVTGPTGSGKTTTLYSALNKARNEATNIITVEDPIEYKLAGINQVQVNEKQGLTFAAVLRSVLRQDPDTIMVGEIRDRETADIAFQAAMTGHLVFSTLHTNDAVSTISRLLDMGLDRFKISPSLLAITSQRLVRRLCPACAKKVPEKEMDKTLLEAMTRYGFETTAYKAVGCKNCDNQGYTGRTSLVEVLKVTDRIKDLINSGASAGEITRVAIEAKFLRTMTQDALWHLSKGHTDLLEISPYIHSDNKFSAPERRRAPAGQPWPPAASAPLPFQDRRRREAPVIPAEQAACPPVLFERRADRRAADTPHTNGVPVFHERRRNMQYQALPPVPAFLSAPVVQPAPPVPAVRHAHAAAQPPGAPHNRRAGDKRHPAPFIAPPLSKAAKGKLRVMIAEDYHLLRKLLKKLMEEAGFEVIEAMDGEEAFSAIASAAVPDLLISDIHMPRMDGCALLKGVRETLNLRELPVIILTNESSDKSQELAFKLGADDYILKPFKAPLLIARVTAALRRAGKL